MFVCVKFSIGYNIVVVSCGFNFSFPKIEVANSKGRVAQTTNVVMGGTVTDDATDEWLVLDKQVSYPLYWVFHYYFCLFFLSQQASECAF